VLAPLPAYAARGSAAPTAGTFSNQRISVLLDHVATDVIGDDGQ